MRLSNIAYSVSQPCLILAGAYVLPLGFSIAHRDGLWLLFLAHIGAMLAIFFALRLLNRAPRELTIREAFLIVALSWVTMAFFGCTPYVFSGAIPDLAGAYFESMSGFTTTGATVLRDIEALPKSLLVWRSTTHWLGGMGVIALAVAIFPYLGVGAYQLFKAEVPGPSKDRISPRIADTSKILWFVYLLLTVAQAVLLMVGGLSFFESLTTTFGTMATGGFAVKNASIAAFPSPYVQYVIALFMLLAGANFTLHYAALRGKLGVYLRDAEFRFYLGVILSATVGLSLLRLASGEALGEPLVRGSLFTTVSIITTTGFVTDNFDLWPLAGRVILVLLMFIGGCASSTGGAIKNVRIVVLLKSIGSELKRLFHPRSVFPVKLSGEPVPETIVANIMAFIGLYVLFYVAGLLAMLLLGLDLATAVGGVAATLGNVGPGLGAVGAVGNYAAIPAPGKWVFSALMMAGRLELLPIAVLFTRHFWH